MNTVILCAVVVTVLGVAIVFLGLMRVGGKRNEHPQRSRRNKVLAIVGIILFASVFASALGMAGRVGSVLRLCLAMRGKIISM